MKEYVVYYLVLTVLCFVARLILENTRFFAFASKMLTVVIVVCMAIPLVLGINEVGFSLSESARLPIDQTFVQNMNGLKLNLLREEMIAKLKDEADMEPEIEFETRGEGVNIEIVAVIVYLNCKNTTEKPQNLRIIALIRSVYNIDEEQIEVYD